MGGDVIAIIPMMDFDVFGPASRLDDISIFD
jgi:hypothetical protein